MKKEENLEKIIIVTEEQEFSEILKDQSIDEIISQVKTNINSFDEFKDDSTTGIMLIKYSLFSLHEVYKRLKKEDEE
jgi:hypothetical protein